MTTEELQTIRATLKETCNGIGDKVYTLLQIRSEMCSADAVDDMFAIIEQLEAVHTKLIQWGGKHLAP